MRPFAPLRARRRYAGLGPDLGRLRARRVVIALALALAAVEGVTQLVDFGRPSSDTQSDARHVATHGIRLTVSRTWTATAAAPEIAGLDAGSALSLVAPGTDVRVVAGLVPYSGPNLLPAALSPAGAGPPAGTRVVLGEHLQAYSYRGLRVPHRGGLFDVYAVPGTEGIAILACQAPDLVAWMRTQCRLIADTLEITRGRPLPATRDAAFRARLPVTLRALDATRTRTRRELAAAGSGPDQAAALDRLAGAYGRSARSLRAMVPGTSEAAAGVVDAFAAADRAFAAVATALRIGDVSAFDSARVRARAAERRLDRLARTYAGGDG